MSKRTPKSVKASCDKLFSRIVRGRLKCERCGESRFEQLQCAHIYSRRYSSTRHDEDNALCLCAGCHRWTHDNPIEFTRWIDNRWPSKVDGLIAKKELIGKRKMKDWLKLEDELKLKLTDRDKYTKGDW